MVGKTRIPENNYLKESASLCKLMFVNKAVISIAVVLVIVLGAGYFVMNRGGTAMQSTMPSQSATPMASTMPSSSPTTGDEMKSFTLEEVAKHATPTDCWMIVDGIVYDVSPYIAQQKHPGGAAILEGCGKDATSIFKLRPQDGKPHSEGATNMLSKFMIGQLAK